MSMSISMRRMAVIFIAEETGWEDGWWRPPGSSGLQFCVRVRARAVIGPVIRAQVEGSDCRMGSRDE